MPGDPRSAGPLDQSPIGWHPPHPAPGKPRLGLATPSNFPRTALPSGGEGRVRGAARTDAVRSKPAPALPRPESRAAVRHRAAHMGDRRSVRAAGENRNRRGAPSPSSEIGATPDLRQSARVPRPGFCPAFARRSQTKLAMRAEPDELQAGFVWLPVNQDEIWSDVAIAVIVPFAAERVMEIPPG